MNFNTTLRLLKMKTKLFAACAVSTLLLTGCSGLSAPFLGSGFFGSGSQYLESGTIILSHQVPQKGESPATVAMSIEDNSHNAESPASDTVGSQKPPQKILAPLVGYFPPAVTYLPADNETWLEINRENKMIVLYKGKGVIKEIQGEGSVSIAPGDYYLQHKQKQPLWYAPNDYFAKRQLSVPSANDRLRYRRGALGKFALFPTTTFPIHCAPIWTEDVGGLRVSATDLSSIYYMLPVGAPIVVK